MKTSSAGRALIKSFEGLRLKPYYCSAGKLTIGYGSTGAHVKAGMVLTSQQADDLLAKDLIRFEAAVLALFPARKEGDAGPLTQNQFDALVSFAFNVGTANLRSSTLARKLQAGDMAGAAAEFKKWDKATVGGKKVALAGLTRRRAAEAALFVKP